MAFLDIEKAQKNSKTNKGHKGYIKGQINKSITFYNFSPFWDHCDLMEWKMTLGQIPRPERPLKGHLIA